MGGVSGAAAAAATTPLDVVKTRMMCSASSRPTIAASVRAVMAEGSGMRPFFRGVGPRALSNGLNSAIFFMFFEAIRKAGAVHVRRRRCGWPTNRRVPHTHRPGMRRASVQRVGAFSCAQGLRLVTWR